MTRTEADALAREVHAATGHDARVELGDNESGFVVVVPIPLPRSGALREEFVLWDELDWDLQRDRIASA